MRYKLCEMGVHTQGESGFFDEDTEVLLIDEQNEAVQLHESAANNGSAPGKMIPSDAF